MRKKMRKALKIIKEYCNGRACGDCIICSKSDQDTGCPLTKKAFSKDWDLPVKKKLLHTLRV